MGYGDII